MIKTGQVYYVRMLVEKESNKVESKPFLAAARKGRTYARMNNIIHSFLFNLEVVKGA